MASLFESCSLSCVVNKRKSKMALCPFWTWKYSRTGPIFLVLGCILVFYFLVMDILVFNSLQKMTLMEPPNKGGYSPLRPLSVKLLMMDHMSHYIFNPIAELVVAIFEPTGVYHIVTPNVISITGLVLGFVSAKFVSMESLQYRRIGIIIFQYRMWLDVLDGVVFRHTSGDPVYKSHRSSLGFFIDIDCDILSGVALAFGCLFYLWKYPPVIESRELLPQTKTFLSGRDYEDDHSSKTIGIKATKNYIFLKALTYGVVILIASSTWDNVVQAFVDLLQTPLDTTMLTEKQTEAVHSTVTFFSMYLWRFGGSQALLTMIQIAVFSDKIWEFLIFIQYAGFVGLAMLNSISYIQIYHLRDVLEVTTS
ncbi:ceramide phosphoethanolamine synthase-like [Ylistrum balloti]|uniref:ceramide phosphoethanolamine synthase-like n=1 Tax=Ylistrum balloti TaxID=509963 RepID=UPI002905D944|nr:ceramide phosphoethanolamine synthase-like [Ylistrum balloti]